MTTLLVVPAIVLAIIDGDTVKVRAFPWLPGWSVEVNVRVKGIDTPELPSHTTCLGEGVLGDAAKRYAVVEFAGRRVALIGVSPDKYGDRVVARVVRDDDGVDWGALLLASGLARPYSGSGPKPNWCS